MIYEIIVRRFRVCALMIDRDFVLTCDAWEFLRDQNKVNPGQVRGMKVLFERYAEHGKAKLPTDLLHHADQKEDILQFIKGQLRLFCFTDGNSIILTHGALKKTQKADSAEVREAIRRRDMYFNWKETQR